MAHAFNHSMWKAETGRFLWGQGQHGLQSEFRDIQGYTEKAYLEKPINKQPHKLTGLHVVSSCHPVQYMSEVLRHWLHRQLLPFRTRHNFFFLSYELPAYHSNTKAHPDSQQPSPPFPAISSSFSSYHPGQKHNFIFHQLWSFTLNLLSVQGFA